MIMKITTIKYHLKQGISAIMKNRLMSFISIATVAACAFILIITLCIVINLDYILEQIETTIGISVFIGDSVDNNQIYYLKNKILKIEHVKEVKYLSKEDALKWAKDTWGESSILEGLEIDNPFPRSFDITLDNVRYQKSVIKSLEKLQTDFENMLIKGIFENPAGQQPVQKDNEDETIDIENKNYEFKGIEKIRHAQRESEMLVTINTALRVVGLTLVIIMAVIAISIIMNTIKLTVFIRKNEINIMKYIGATDWFIRWPFIIEGITIGLIGALIPSIVCWVGYNKSIEFINEKIAVIQQFANFKESGEIFLTVMPVTLFVGALIGAFGSITSIRRHLNV